MKFWLALLFLNSAHAALHLEFDAHLRSRVTGEAEFSPSETLTIEKDGKPVILRDFPQRGRDKLSGQSGTIRKTVKTWRSPAFPGALFVRTTYRNVGIEPVMVLGWESLRHSFPVKGGVVPWAYLPSSSSDRTNWLQPFPEGSAKENFLGMTSTDYGGGTPLVALWTRERGLAAGVVTKTPPQISLPLAYLPKGEPTLAVAAKKTLTLAPGKSFDTPTGFLYEFRGDAYQPLRAFAKFVAHGRALGPEAPRGELGPIWCAWGYGREFSLAQIRNTLATVKKLGFEWVGLDDGWQEAIGDWQPNRKKFPNGEADLKKFINEIHRQGLKVQLWWAPLAAHKESRYVKRHREQLIQNADGSPRDITWWDAWYLCPADDAVIKNVEQLTRKFFAEWRIDGLKLDGQHLNASPACYNPAHHHARPELSAELHSRAQRKIFETALAVRREALVEACPCGTSYSIYNLPFQNMTVGADPVGSIQVRQKGKMLHALSGDRTVYFGDHVELTGEKQDFASTIGLGGLVGSNFTLASQDPPPPPPDDPVTILTPEREAHWAKWVRIARDNPLWRGEYLGELYDVAFDVPEAHAVRLGHDRYYAFYAENFAGEVELRGLTKRAYSVVDYVSGASLGTVTGPTARLKTSFAEHLLLRVSPR